LLAHHREQWPAPSRRTSSPAARRLEGRPRPELSLPRPATAGATTHSNTSHTAQRARCVAAARPRGVNEAGAKTSMGQPRRPRRDTGGTRKSEKAAAGRTTVAEGLAVNEHESAGAIGQPPPPPPAAERDAPRSPRCPTAAVSSCVTVPHPTCAPGWPNQCSVKAQGGRSAPHRTQLWKCCAPDPPETRRAIELPVELVRDVERVLRTPGMVRGWRPRRPPDHAARRGSRRPRA